MFKKVIKLSFSGINNSLDLYGSYTTIFKNWNKIRLVSCLHKQIKNIV